MHDNVVDSNASDWSDLDLLTTAEAGERLAKEIVEIERQLADPSGLGGDAGREKLERRVTLLRKRLSS